MGKENHCINCGQQLIEARGVKICRQCNTGQTAVVDPFKDESLPDDYVMIECPGATLYQPGTNEIIGGVKFLDGDDPFKGYTIIGEPVFAPTHKRKRMIKREALGRIRRCQGCQDYTVRMRRKEGADFFIPSHKHPGRTKLKSVRHYDSEP